MKAGRHSMELVVDTNVVVSALLKAGVSRALLFRPDWKLASPEKLAEEIEKHRQELIEKARMDEGEFETAVRMVLSNIKILQFESYSAHLKKAYEISPDKDDAIFLAAALALRCPIWSNDKRLKQQEDVQVCSTAELLRRISRR